MISDNLAKVQTIEIKKEETQKEKKKKKKRK